MTSSAADNLHAYLTLNTPSWATSTREPDVGDHEGTVTAAGVSLTIGQDINLIRHLPVEEPIFVWLPEAERLFGAQECRDLAAALLEAARVIDGAMLSMDTP